MHLQIYTRVRVVFLLKKGKARKSGNRKKWEFQKLKNTVAFKKIITSEPMRENDMSTYLQHVSVSIAFFCLLFKDEVEDQATDDPAASMLLLHSYPEESFSSVGDQHPHSPSAAITSRTLPKVQLQLAQVCLLLSFPFK